MITRAGESDIATKFFSVPAPPDWRVDWEALQQNPWVRELADCPQDPVHHAEGNVWIHTRMVLETLAADARFKALSPERRLVLFTAALFHDAAKPVTTAIEADGRVTARGHSLRGSIMARSILWKMDFPFHLREDVCGLVRYHQIPFYLIDRADAQRLASAISLVCCCDELSILAEADIRGRICQDEAAVLQSIALFREFCAEEGCLNGPRVFPSAHSRVEYFRHPGRAIDYCAFDNTTVRVVVMSGLPGSGKDTWIVEHYPDLPVISLDMLREELDVAPTDDQGTVVQAAKARAREYLRRRESFIWNATNISRAIRNQVLSLLFDYKAEVRLVYVESSYRALFSHNASRVKAVPPAVIDRLLQRWEIPDLTEAHHLEYVVNG